MLLWSAGQVDLLEAALARARGGTPSVLLVEGAPGTGKSSLLEELVERAEDFMVTSTEGLESTTTAPFSVLRDWGLGVPGDLSPEEGWPAAVQLMTSRLDELTRERPVLWLVDDVQWADPESIEVLRTVLRRLDGTPLLVALGRRLPYPRHAPGVDDLVRPRSRNATVTLSGLSVESAVQIVAEAHPDLGPGAALDLYRHTEGNPLYLTSLLDELGADELDALPRGLPAPRAFADAVERKLDRLTPRTRDVIEAAVVLGSGWSTVLDVAAVADRSDPFEAIQRLVDADLLVVRLGGSMTVRPVHALVGAAVRQLIPLPRRAQLHRRAADVVSGPDALDHRLAAVSGYDAELAGEVAAHADALYAAATYRHAAHYYAAAADLAEDAGRRRRLWLESQWCAVLAGRASSAEFASGEVGPDDPLTTSVAVLGEVSRHHIGHALQILDRLDADAVGAAEPTTRHRLLLLSAYVRLLGGQSTARVLEAVGALDASGGTDPALLPLESPVRGFVAARQYGDSAELVSILETVPENPADALGTAPELLGWRAVYRVHSLHVREGVRDLEAMVDRLHHTRDVGALHQLLALGRWFAGDWPLARVASELSPESTGVFGLWNPDISGALLAAVRGRFSEADSRLEATSRTHREAVWPEGRLFLLVGRVARVHAAGLPDAEVAALVADYHDIEELLEVTSPADANLLVHAGLLGIWADRPAITLRCADVMARASQPSRSHPALVAWLRGLGQARQQDSSAITLLEEAAADDRNELPLYRAHMWADLADILDPVDPVEASRARGRALDGYRRLGAVPYVQRVVRVHEGQEDPVGPDDRASVAQDVSVTPMGAAAPPVAPGPAFTPVLTDRERDVVALLVKGLSYNQIAGQLYVTRSAVSFHLSNVYAKFGVSSRHELTAHVIANPTVLPV